MSPWIKDHRTADHRSHHAHLVQSFDRHLAEVLSEDITWLLVVLALQPHLMVYSHRLNVLNTIQRRPGIGTSCAELEARPECGTVRLLLKLRRGGIWAYTSVSDWSDASGGAARVPR
jgi:hypothetical protein